MAETFSMYLDFALTKLICIFTFSSDFLGDFLGKWDNVGNGVKDTNTWKHMKYCLRIELIYWHFTSVLLKSCKTRMVLKST